MRTGVAHPVGGEAIGNPAPLVNGFDPIWFGHRPARIVHHYDISVHLRPCCVSLGRNMCEVVTVEIKINLLAPAMGDELVATGHLVRAGRSLSVVTAEVVAMTGDRAKTVALLQGTMMPVPL